jgi:hypothetical protein
MATITGLTAERMLEIEAASIVDGEIIADHLILTKQDGSPIDAGVVTGPPGSTGPTGATGPGVPTGGTTGQVLKKNSGTNYDTGWATPSGIIPVGLTLPGSPAIGDEAILVDSLTVPTYAWRFRYDSGITDAYEWLFVGGSPAEREIVTAESASSGSYVALTTAGPSFTLPRAGIYEVEVGAVMNCSAVTTGLMSYDIGGTGAVDADAARWSGAAGYVGSVSLKRVKTFASASALVSKYKSGASLSVTYGPRFMRVLPIRV